VLSGTRTALALPNFEFEIILGGTDNARIKAVEGGNDSACEELLRIFGLRGPHSRPNLSVLQLVGSNLGEFPEPDPHHIVRNRITFPYMSADPSNGM